MIMKKMFLEFVVLALIIVSGIVWANNVLHKSDDVFAIKNKVQIMDNEEILSYQSEFSEIITGTLL